MRLLLEWYGRKPEAPTPTPFGGRKGWGWIVHGLESWLASYRGEA